MKPIAYDVYLCSREPLGQGLAQTVAAGLTRLGFRVFVGDRAPGSVQDERRLRLIEDTPDFVVLSSPEAGKEGGRDSNPLRIEIAHAFKTGRNVLVMADPRHADPLADARPPGVPPLPPWQRLAYDPDRVRESIALLGYRLLSSSDVEERRLMQTAKQAFIAAGLILLAAVAIKAVPAMIEFWTRPKPKPPLPPFSLYSCAFGQRLDAGRWAAFTPGEGGAVSSGDQVRLVFSPSADGFAYVVSKDVRGGVSVLYPAVTIRGASRVRAGTAYEVPAGGSWLPLDEQAGLDTIYLLAGYEPLENLEELVEESDGNMDPAVRRDLLSSTLTGLLDGRHAAVRPPVRTRNGQAIVENLPAGPGPAECSATLANGSVVTRRFTGQRGLVSALVEIRVRNQPGR
jgi:hypothetical protein